MNPQNEIDTLIDACIPIGQGLGKLRKKMSDMGAAVNLDAFDSAETLGKLAVAEEAIVIARASMLKAVCVLDEMMQLQAPPTAMDAEMG